MTKTTTKSAADSAMALLGQAMDRNTRLAASPVVAATTPQAFPVEQTSPQAPGAANPTPIRPASPKRAGRRQGRTTGLRLTPEDHARINGILKQALGMGERIPMSDAVRLALMAYNPAVLSESDLEGLNALDGRTRDGKGNA
jgi:hypothetical protein